DVYLVQGAPLGKGKPLTPPPASPPRDRLFENRLDQEKGLRFEDVTDAAGLAATGYGMGVAAGDVDNDGDVDLYVTNYGPNQLWRNRGDGTFEDVTAASGTDDPRWSTS
ncbi:MAG: CRTAC1 family protein, partial [Gammaproteobacteria bacterium]|nr:CRTAC1 family protein [Gammaproteobacteria bacterium]